MGLALFDFDGTISSRDSFLHFMSWVDQYRLLLTMVRRFPQVLLFKMGRYPNQRLKEIFLTDMFGGQSRDSWGRDAEEFCTRKVPSMIRAAFWERHRYHAGEGHTMVVVTATPRLILEPWCRRNAMQIIGSELETGPDGSLTGRLVGSNCMGKEKVARISEQFDLAAHQELFAYGDTAGDLPMLDLAPPRNRYYQPFR